MLVLVLIVVSFYFGMIYEPFIQHVYLTATTGNEINLRASIKFAHGRLLAFLGAYLLAFIVVIPILSLWMSKLPYDVIMNYEGHETEIFMNYGCPCYSLYP